MNAYSITAHPNGKKVYSFLLQNNNGTVVEITNYGAIIMAIKLKKNDGTFNDVVLGFDKPEHYWSEEYLLNYPYYGAAIGRYANRIKGSAIEIDGKTYRLGSQDAYYTLHGGIEGFDKKVWSVIRCEKDRLVMRYISADGEEGFPGQIDVMISFELNDQDELSYEYTATTEKPTAINLTHHSYFNLNNGKGKADNNHFLKVYASKYLEQDDSGCATGVIKDVANSRNDFRNFRKTGSIAAAAKGIDVSLQLDTQGINNLAAEAFCSEESIMLEVYTTEPIVHLYNAYASPMITGKYGRQYTPFSGFCFETQRHPNAINIPSFPNTILRPDEVYRTKTIYRFGEKK